MFYEMISARLPGVTRMGSWRFRRLVPPAVAPPQQAWPTSSHHHILSMDSASCPPWTPYTLQWAIRQVNLSICPTPLNDEITAYFPIKMYLKL